MRNIKFRAWDKLEKRMRKVVSLHWQGDKLVSARLEGENEPIPIEGRLVIEQYAGHEAEACIPVYDGDIVTLYDNQFCEDLGVGVVKSSCYLMVDKDGKYMEADMSRDLNNVLGNIHENPELLEEK
mgnify:CR=1 FL=1|jgi:hypothetical protein